MRPTPKQLAWAFFAYFAAISALGPGFHFWPVLGCHTHDHGIVHGHDHGHSHHDHGHTHHDHKGSAPEHPGQEHNHDDCLTCQYYAQTQLPPADLPEVSQGYLYHPAPALVRQMPREALPTPYAPRGPPQV